MRPVRSRHASGSPAADGPRPAIRRRVSTVKGEAGQSLVEFSLVLTPLMLVLLGIIQFGFIFNSSVTLTNAAREGARAGTIYQFDRTCSKAQNDMLRNEVIRTSLITSMNLMGKTSPQFATTAPSGTGCSLTGGWTSATSGTTTTYHNGDLTVTYTVPSGVTDTDPRPNEQVLVSALYHQDLIIPLIANLLPRDANGRLGLTGQVTMVLN